MLTSSQGSTYCLKNRLQALQALIEEEKEITMDNNWKGIKEAITSTWNEVLGSKHKYEEWISLDSLDRIQGGKSKESQIRGWIYKSKTKEPYASISRGRRDSHSSQQYQGIWGLNVGSCC